MARKFAELRARMSPRARQRAEKLAAQLRASLPLYQLRQAMKFSQEDLAAELGISQAAVSRLERRPDLYVSTLQRYVRAMGGELELRAKFRGGEVTLLDLGEPRLEPEHRKRA